MPFTAHKLARASHGDVHRERRHLLATVTRYLHCGMLLRLVALVLVTLLGRSALAGNVVMRARWAAASRVEVAPLSATLPASRLVVARELPAPAAWRSVQPGPRGASASTSTPALGVEGADDASARARATRINSLVRASAAHRRALPYDATAPPGA